VLTAKTHSCEAECLYSPNLAEVTFSAPLFQAALREGILEAAMRLLKTASEMRLLRQRSASFRDLPSATFLRWQAPPQASDLAWHTATMCRAHC
jgi:hypothetical protein